MVMYAEERQHEIAEKVRRDGKVTVSELAGVFDITPETIRRDLKVLERQGVLRRVHGGAIEIARFRSEPAVSERTGHMVDEKTRIAEAALDLVPKSGAILLDAGTTTNVLAERIPADRDLTVITNSLPIATSLSTRSGIALWVVGGRCRPTTLATVDDWALRTLHQLRVDVAFIATNGITAGGGLTTPDLGEAAVKRAMVESGRQVVLLADHSKLGEEHLVSFADTSQIDVLITDDAADPHELDAIRSIGVEVRKA